MRLREEAKFHEGQPLGGAIKRDVLARPWRGTCILKCICVLRGSEHEGDSTDPVPTTKDCSRSHLHQHFFVALLSLRRPLESEVEKQRRSVRGVAADA